MVDANPAPSSSSSLSSSSSSSSTPQQQKLTKFYYVIYYKRSASERFYQLMRVVSTHVEKYIPTNLTVTAMRQYRSFSYRNLPVMHVATGNECVEYTLANWHHHKRARRYEFVTKRLEPHLFNKDVASDHVLVPVRSLLSWFQVSAGKTRVTRIAEAQFESAHLLLPLKVREPSALQPVFARALRRWQRADRFVLFPK